MVEGQVCTFTVVVSHPGVRLAFILRVKTVPLQQVTRPGRQMVHPLGPGALTATMSICY